MLHKIKLNESSFEKIKNGTKTKSLDDLRKSIENFNPFNEQEEVDKRRVLNALEVFDDVLTRQNEYCHFTSSAFVLNKERTKVLMIYHNIFKSWACVGGHTDGDSNLLYVAMKEAKEETGVENIKPISNEIYSLEVVPCEGHIKRGKYVGTHVHFNVIYLLEADEKETLKIKPDENSGVKWIPIDEVLDASTEEWIKNRVYAKVIEKMKAENYI